MKTKIILIAFFLFSLIANAQRVKIDSTYFTIKHNTLTFYLDKDTASFVSVQKVKLDELKKLTGKRYDKWFKEKPFGPYKKDYYEHTGYDLGHLTPSDITSYSDTVNKFSFSLFNQAPQLAAFNRGKWNQLEQKVSETLVKEGSGATIITGVIYDNVNKTYLGKSRIKIPISYYKIVVTKKKTVCYIGSNINGEIITTDLKTILEIARKNKNQIGITIQ